MADVDTTHEELQQPRRSRYREELAIVEEKSNSPDKSGRDRSSSSRRPRDRSRASSSGIGRSRDKSKKRRASASEGEAEHPNSPRPNRSNTTRPLTRSERHDVYQSDLLQSRKERMSTWRQIWTINGFLTPRLSGYIKAFFHSALLRWLGRQTPWMLMISQIGMAGLVGTTGLGVIPDEGIWGGAGWFAEYEGSKLGGWGYCDSAGACVVQPFYDIRSPDHPEIWYSTIFFSWLILSVGAAGMLLLLGGIWALLFRLLPESASCLTCSGCGSCIESAIDKTIAKSEVKEEEDGDLREPKEMWQVVLERVMWGFGIWVGIVFVLLEVWQRVLNAQGLVGDTVLTFLFGFAMSWLVVWWVYKSYWALGIEEATQSEDS